MSTTLPTTPQPGSTTDKSPSRLSSSTTTPTHRRRSPPLPKLNLDDCKSILTTTTTNTSNNAARKPSSAFVFTSSRTLRNLHNYHSPRGNSALLPPAEIIPTSQSTDSTSSSHAVASESSQKQAREKPKLSADQLARHSMGALDARCIVSSNMRAAGFVPLTHSPSSDPSAPPTPWIAPVPTPKEPPRFPPVLFVNTLHNPTAPLWDYQRNLSYGLGQGPSIALGYTSADTTSKMSVAIQPTSSFPLAAAQDTAATKEAKEASERPSQTSTHSSSQSSMSSASASSLFSSISQSSSGLTSVASSNPQTPSQVLKPLHERFEAYSSRENHNLSVYKDDIPGVDGYPFPRPYNSSSEPSSRNRSQHPAQYPAHATASPAISWTTGSGSITPMAQSPLSPPPPAEESTPVFASNVHRPDPKPVQRKPPSFKSKAAKERDARRGPEERKQALRSSISLTELCSSSPLAWYSSPIVLPPSSSKSSYGQGSSSSSLLTSSSGSGSTRRQSSASSLRQEGSSGSQDVVNGGSRGSDESTAVDVEVADKVLVAEVPELDQLAVAVGPEGEKVAGAVVLASVPEVEEGKEGGDTGSEKSSRRGRQRERDADREIEREKRRERRRLKGKMREMDLAAVDALLAKASSLTSSGTSSSGSENGKKRSSPSSKKAKDKSTKDARIAAAAYAPMFPPKDVKSGVEKAHVLGTYDAILAREREREAGAIQKDQVLAHRERDREYARLTEHWSLSDEDAKQSQKKHASRAMVSMEMVPMHSSSTTFDSARGRGRTRGERPPMRILSSAASVLSDGETMVGENDRQAAQVAPIVET